MAPKGMKRPAGSSAGAAAKKQATGKCSAICSALTAASGPLPEAVLSMISKMLPDALLTYAEERHEFQVTAVAMAGQALAAIEAELQAAIVPLEAKVAGAEQEEAARKAAQSSAQADLDAKKADVAAKKEAFDTSKAVLATAIAAVGDAEKAQKEGDSDAEKTVKLKDQMAALMATFEALKTADVKAKDLKAALKSLDTFASEFSFDKEVVKSAHKTLSTPAADRGTFDGMIIAELDKVLGEAAASIEATIANAMPEKEARAAAVEAAIAARTAANDQNLGNSIALTDAQKALAEAEAALKAATAHVKSFSSEAAAAVKECKAAKDKLETFQGKAMAAFAELQAYAPPPPPPAPVVEEPAAEAAPAEPAPEA